MITDCTLYVESSTPMAPIDLFTLFLNGFCPVALCVVGIFIRYLA